MTIHILDYADELASHFRSINLAWIEDMFVLEPHDAHVLDHPRETIIDRGGVILFAARSSGEIIGTGALMPSVGRAFELTKMGVLKEARGTGAGNLLLSALLERAHALGANPLYLLTNTKCSPAIHLYEKAGFVHDPIIMDRFGGDSARCDVAMSIPMLRNSDFLRAKTSS